MYNLSNKSYISLTLTILQVDTLSAPFHIQKLRLRKKFGCLKVTWLLNGGTDLKLGGILLTVHPVQYTGPPS